MSIVVLDIGHVSRKGCEASTQPMGHSQLCTYVTLSGKAKRQGCNWSGKIRTMQSTETLRPQGWTRVIWERLFSRSQREDPLCKLALFSFFLAYFYGVYFLYYFWNLSILKHHSLSRKVVVASWPCAGISPRAHALLVINRDKQHSEYLTLSFGGHSCRARPHYFMPTKHTMPDTAHSFHF